jgi:hypothetical protein
MPTTGIALFAFKRMIPQHRQWVTRSYAVSLVFLDVRWNNPFNWQVVEIAVWVCIAFGDLANQWYGFSRGDHGPREPKTRILRYVQLDRKKRPSS